MSELVTELSNPGIRTSLSPGQLWVVLLGIYSGCHYCLCISVTNIMKLTVNFTDLCTHKNNQLETGTQVLGESLQEFATAL
jgi:hypothetical protein